MKPIYLRTIRERKKLTQAQLGERAGVLQKTISKLETDSDTKPAFDTVAKLADALGIDPRALKFGPDPARGREALAS